MAQKKRRPPYEPIEESDEKHFALRKQLIPVLEKHFSECTGFNPKKAAGDVLVDYDTIMYDFWSKEEAAEALDKLKRSLMSLSDAYTHLPHLVADRLELDASHQDDLTKQKFLNETKADVLFSYMLPERGASIACEALEPLAKHHAELVAAIDITRRELPKGMPTRNRHTFNEWALIHACVRLVRRHNAMNIPKAMDSSGSLCNLLRDVFAIFGLEKTSFKTVFKSWKDNMDGKYENFDLMTI